MKKVTVIAILAVFIIFAKFSFSQSVGINTASPYASAALQINSSADGFQGILIPQVPLVSRVVSSSAIPTATTGLLVYNMTTEPTENLVPGFYFCTGNSWQELISNDRIYGFAAYGELYESKNFNEGTLYPLTLGVWSPWVSATAGLNENVFPDINGTDYLQVVDPGAYQVNLAVSFQGDNSMQVSIQAFVLHPDLSVEGLPKIQTHFKLTSNGDLVSGAASGVVDLDFGDKIFVQFRCENATKNIQVEIVNLSIGKISVNN